MCIRDRLSTDKSYFFVYDETVAYKGADEVASFFVVVVNILDISVKNLFFVILAEATGHFSAQFTILSIIAKHWTELR